jgi:type II secretory pathway pseudopilin PulG
MAGTIKIRQYRGVAIVMVIAILAGLMALAAPFVFSMIQQSRAARSDLHAMRARQGAQAAVAHGIAQLYTTLRFDPKDDSPEVTTLQDLKIPMEFPAATTEFNNLNLDLQNADGTLWGVRVEDEQGKVNINSAMPALIGNLLGSAVTTDKTVTGDTSLTVDDTSSFIVGVTNNDAQRIKGTVYLEGEVLRYTDIRGTKILLADAVQRGHSSGALVYDGRAQLIADYPYKAGGRRFASIYEVKMACGASGMAPDEFARLERLITVHSGLDGPEWGHFPLPTAQGPGSSTNVGNAQQPLRQPPPNSTQADSGIGPGTLLRDAQSQAFGRLSRVSRRPDGTLNLEFAAGAGLNISGQQQGPVGNQGGQAAIAYVEPLQLHPININTAPRDVIAACFKGLCLETHNAAIRRNTAEALADYMLGQKRVFATKEDLRKVFQQAFKAGILTQQERDACFINATEPGSLKLRMSTAPFCFGSLGTYTVEGSGVENTDNGVQLARNTVRQIVTMPTVNQGRFKIQYQAGFQDLIDRGLTSRVVTFPVPIQVYRTQRDAPDLYLPDSNSGSIRLDVGESGLFNLPGEQYDHCSNPQDPGFRQDGYDMRHREPWTLDPATTIGQNPNRVASVPTSIEMWIRPLSSTQCVLYEEGLEEERNRVTFSYDPRHQPVGGLVISIYDAGLECKDGKVSFQHLKRKPVEFIYPTTLEAGDWYHVAGSWKTSQPNGQEIRLDAQPVPSAQDGVIVNRPGTKLGADLGLDDVDALELEDADKVDFPSSGAVQVGEEIIEYQVRAGTTLKQLNRGARLSAIAKHSSGELVVPYGYSNALAQTLRVGGATLTDDVEAANVTHTNVNMPVPPNKVPYVLDSDTSKIPVDDATNFPSSGYVICEGEVLYYGKKSATTLEQLQRAYKGPARNLHNRSQITLCSIQISNSTQYDTQGIVQVDDEKNPKKVEWIYHNAKEIVNGKHYLVGLIYLGNTLGGYRTGTPEVTAPNGGSNWGLSNFRNQFGIGGIQMGHTKKTKAIPVVRMSGPQCGNQASPYGDQGISEVSVIEKGRTDGDLHYVKQAYIAQYPNFDGQPCPQTRFTGWGFDYYVGLEDFVTRDFPGNTTRYLKWPSGELPDAVGAKRHVFSDRNGEGRLQGHADEWILNIHNSYSGRIAMTTEGQGIKASDDQIDLEDYNAWPQNGDVGTNLNWPTTGGLVRIEDELLYYKTASTADIQFYADVFPPLKDKPPQRNKADRQVSYCGKTESRPNIHTRHITRLTGVIRGVFGTKSEKHPVGANAMLFDGMAISTLTGLFKVKDDMFTVKNAAGFPREGYAMIGNSRYGTEVVSWLTGGTSCSGCEPFRGRFGTSESDHEADEIVRCLPFRYWDRDSLTYDGAGLAYVQSGYYAPEATWDGIDLTLTGTEEQPRPNTVRPRVLVRYDGKPGWDAEPSNQPGGLYEFLYRDGYVPLGGVKANQVEVRVYWDFVHGSFQPNLDWKRTFSIEKLRGIYHTPLIMRRMDEIERR